jgi:hypothetical protein
MSELILKARDNGQLSGMAGEFLTAGKLFKRRYQVSVTMGNAKSIDLFVHNPETDKTFNVQVKTVRAKNCFPCRRETIKANLIYVFVILHGPAEQEEFFILPGKTILADISKFFGSSYRREKPSSMPGINYGPLKDFKDNWSIFDR